MGVGVRCRPWLGAALPLLAACGVGSGLPTGTNDTTVASIDVLPDVVLLTSIGQDTTFTAIARDSRGNVIPGVTFQWSSSDGAVASVESADGTVTAVAPGSPGEVVAVSATARGVSATSDVWVLLPEYAAVDVNSGGDVVGTRTVYELDDTDAPRAVTTAVAWPAAGAATAIPGLGGTGSSAAAVNDARLVAGTARTSAAVDHAFVWTVGDAAATDLGTAGGTSSWAIDVDDDSEVLGTFRTSAQDLHTVIWASDGTPGEVAELGGASLAPAALGLRGEVVGAVTLVGGEVHAFLWSPQGGGVNDLGSAGVGSRAADVNRFGDLVGTTHLPPDTTGPRGFFRTTQGAVTLIGALPAGDESHATALNRNEQVAGWSETAEGPHAVLWTAQGGLQDLGTLGGCCSWAYGISDQGAVVGASRTAAGELRAFIWNAGAMTELGVLSGS